MCDFPSHRVRRNVPSVCVVPPYFCVEIGLNDAFMCKIQPMQEKLSASLDEARTRSSTRHDTPLLPPSFAITNSRIARESSEMRRVATLGNTECSRVRRILPPENNEFFGARGLAIRQDWCTARVPDKFRELLTSGAPQWRTPGPQYATSNKFWPQVCAC